MDGDRMVLAVMRQAVKRDSWNIFLRPLYLDSWGYCIAITSTLVLCIHALPYLYPSLGRHAKVIKHFNNSLIFLAWMIFVIINISYQAILTMYFSTKVNIPFTSIEDVITAYPAWKLMIRPGSLINIIPHIERGDPNFIEFWDRVQNKPEETLFSSIGDVLTNHKNDPVVILTPRSLIDWHNKYGNPEQQGMLEIISVGIVTPRSMVTTKNSPLVPVIKHGVQIMLERGSIQRLKLKWTAIEATIEPSYEGESLDMMHVSLVFASFVILLGSSLVIFFWEIGTNRLYKYGPVLKRKWDRNKSGL